MSPERARERFAAARHALLATADEAGAPHIVPIVFALHADTVYHAVDRKPKRTTALRRFANARVNPQVALLAEHFSEDWDELWWVRAEGSARAIPAAGEEGGAALELLAARYERYRLQPPPGPLMAVEVVRWSGWSARGD